MSTRCTVTTHGADSAFDHHTIYRHCDGAPQGEHGVIQGIRNALALAWPLPRYESDEFAAAIVATWKTTPGNVRLAHGRDEFGDTEWHYDVRKHGNGIQVTASERVTLENGADIWKPRHKVQISAARGAR